MDYISKIKELRQQKQQLIKENKFSEFDALHSKELELMKEIENDKEFSEKYGTYMQLCIKEFEKLLKDDPSTSKHIEFFNYALYNIKYHHKIEPRLNDTQANEAYNIWILNNIIPFQKWFNRTYSKMLTSA